MVKVAMSFIRFADHCKYSAYGCDIDHNIELTCRHPENKPAGCSWGDCKECVCPLLKKEE